MGTSKKPSEKKQLCTAYAVSTPLVVRKHAFDGFPCIYCTYLLFLTQNKLLEVPICILDKVIVMLYNVNIADK